VHLRPCTVARWLLLLVALGCEKAPEAIDARASAQATTSTRAGSTSASAPSTATASPLPMPHAKPGRIEEHTFRSRALGVDKRYLVYVPDAYASDTRRYPVVYLLHGLGGDETNWARHGDLLATADRVGLQALAVLPDGDASFYVNASSSRDYGACLAERPAFSAGEPSASYCVKTPRYEDYLAADIVSEVDARYRTLASRRGRGIGGLSMGGFGALVLGMKHTDLFSAVASTSGLVSLGYAGPHPYAGLASVELSSPATLGAHYPDRVRDHLRGLFGMNPETWRAVDPVVLAASLEPGRLAIHLDCGEDDDFRFDDHARHLHDVLASRQIAHEWGIKPGRHHFDYWKARLPEILQFFQRSLASP